MGIEKITLALALQDLEIKSGECTFKGSRNFYAKLEPLGYDSRNHCLPEYLIKDNGSRYKYFSYGDTIEEAMIKVYEQWISRKLN